MADRSTATWRYEENLIRSATAPEKMVVAVPQNMVWNRKKEIRWKLFPNSGMKPVVPIKPLPESPNMRPNPISQNPMTEKTKSEIFLMATLMLFFGRVSPDSRHMNPGCIKKTSTADTMTQKLSIISLLIAAVFSCLSTCIAFMSVFVS